MAGAYRTSLDNDVRLGKNPTPMLHRSGVVPPIVDVANPVGITGAFTTATWASVTAVWRKTAGLATAKLDLQLLLWDPVAEAWDEGSVISNVAPGQVVVFPVAGRIAYLKIVGVTDVLGITEWKILLCPWESLI